MAPQRICSVEGCDKPPFAKSWCAKHFAIARERGDPLAPKVSKACSIDGCDADAVKRGWCEKHYQRWKKHKDPTKLVRRSHPPILSGVRFGRLTVIAEAERSSDGCLRRRWQCRCDCGAERTVRQDILNRGNNLGCGCYRLSRIIVHGHYRLRKGTPTWRSWASMLNRCSNDNDKEHFKDYRGRGITVCDRWQTFENFLADMGERPSLKHSIDRINNDGNYEPGNCRWATHKQQMRNRRTSHMVEYLGRRMCLADALEISGVTRSQFDYRKRHGWSMERALSNKKTKR